MSATTSNVIPLPGCRAEPVFQDTPEDRRVTREAELLHRIAKNKGVPSTFERALMIARTPWVKS